MTMVRKNQILMIGHNANGCTTKHEKVTCELGMKIATSCSVLITGRLVGVMTATRGSQDTNGFCIRHNPQNNTSEANESCDVVIPTGLGLARDFLNALTTDGVIIVCGGIWNLV